MIKVDKNHFLRAALEIGQSGENDTLPYDVDAAFVKDRRTSFRTSALRCFKTWNAEPSADPWSS